MKRWYLGLAAVALGLAGVVLVYRGPARAIVRGHVGDVAATMLVYALLGLVLRARPAVRAATAFAIALAVEVGQLAWHARSTLGELTVGAHFDPWDLLAYAIGVAIALACELRHLRHAVRVAGSPHALARAARDARL